MTGVARVLFAFRYMRYAGEVRSGDHEYYGGSASYDTGSEVEIKFDATKQPWSIEFTANGTAAGPPVEMTPEDPAAARLHLIICLDEVDDGIEILEIQSNRTASLAGAAGSTASSSVHFSCGTPVVRGPGWTPTSSEEDGGAGNIGYVVRAVPPLAPSITGFVDVWWRGAPAGQVCRCVALLRCCVVREPSQPVCGSVVGCEVVSTALLSSSARSS